MSNIWASSFLKTERILNQMESISFILSIIQVIIVIMATYFALKQLREGTKARQADVIDRAFSYASSNEIRSARRRVRSYKLPDDLNKLSNKQKDDIELTLIGWARIGILLEMGVFDTKDKNVLLRAYSWSIDNTWSNLKRYIEHERVKNGMPDLWDNFEGLATQARTWRQKHNLPIWTLKNVPAKKQNKKKK